MRFSAGFFVCCLAGLFAQDAQAAKVWADGAEYSIYESCPLGDEELASESFAGYETDPSASFPKVGDTGYVHAKTYNIGCQNDSVGFEFFLPVGATLAITASTPIYCIRGTNDGKYTEPVPNSSNSGCSQTPSIGPNGGYFFGYSALPNETSTASGWFLEIQVPVKYSQQLLGIGGPTSDRLNVVATTFFGDAEPYEPVIVFAPSTTPQTQTLVVVTSGSGSVVSSPAGISCGAMCSASFATGSSVTLTATPASGFAFSGWSAGACSGVQLSCVVTMSQSQSVTATFAEIEGSLSVSVSGLPVGSAADLTITGPSGFQDSVSISSGFGTTLSDVQPGSYLVSGSTVVVGATTYAAAAQSATVSGGGAATVTLTYAAQNSPEIGAGSVATGAQVDYLHKSKADFTVWRPSTGYWYSIDGAGGSLTSQWGAPTDLPVIGDFDGDGKSDIAVFRPGTGTWYIKRSSDQQVEAEQWGEASDVPVAGDFDGDGRTDFAVYRPATGYWYVVRSSDHGVIAKQFGLPTDVPVAGDFDGDGKTDIAVYRPSNGYWYITLSSNKTLVATQWGAQTDIPVSGDFDGDGKTDLAVYRPSTGYWYVIQSSNGQVISKQWGQSGDVPVARDYDGDGKTDFAVWRPSTGYWYVIQSSSGQTLTQQWGASSDIPVDSLAR